MLGVGLGLACAIGFAFADFLGGMASRISGPRATMLVSRMGSLPVFLLLLIVVPASNVTSADLLRGVLAGLCVSAALLLLFDVLSRGAMGVSIALTGLMSAVVPLSWALSQGESLGLFGVLGVVVGLASVVVVNWSKSDDSGSRKLDPLQAAAAGVFFGFDFVVIGSTGPDSTVVPLVVSELVTTLVAGVVCLVSRQRFRAAPKFFTIAVASGASASVAAALFLWAVREGAASTAAVLQATAPVFVAVIAFVVLRQRLTSPQLAGVLLAVSATVFFAI